MLAEDSTFWRDPPWGDGKQKYRLGLKPIPLNDWLNREIGAELFDYKTNLLNNRYEDVIGVTHDSTEAQEILGKQFNIEKRRYPDLIADISLLIQDDLCLIKSDGNQELLAASVCSPSYWNIKSKIGKPLNEIHEPVTTLNEKIGERISKFIRQAPVMKPFARQNWLIHGDTKRFHLAEEQPLQNHPSEWFVRSEKETLCRFHEDYSLFTINVLFQPLNIIFEYPEQKQNLLRSLERLDKDESNYFGGSKKITILLEYLSG